MFKSLRSRVIATALIAVGVASSMVLLVIGLLIEPVAEQRQNTQMTQVLAEAIAFDGVVPIDQLATHLAQPGISVVIDADGETYSAGLLSDIIVKHVQLSGSTYIQMQTTLPISKATVSLTAIRPSVIEMWAPIFAIGVPTILATLVVVGLTLRQATRIALRPLDDMTALATEIADGQSGGRLAVSDPNSELGRTAVAFDKMLDSLENSLSRAKAAEERLRQLCADVAHELRSPLASIIAAADNLMRNTEPKKHRELAENTALSVVRDGRRAAHIVGDLTLAAQLDVDELAKRQLLLQNTDLIELVKTSVDSFAHHANVSVNFNSALSRPQLFSQVDPQRIQQILVNLLENANRYAKSQIAIDLKLDESNQMLVVEVFNDGAEIPKNKREAIFDRFVRLDATRDRATGGSGLGLFISRSLAEAHGGTLKNIAAADGAVFELRLPVIAS